MSHTCIRSIAFSLTLAAYGWMDAVAGQDMRATVIGSLEFRLPPTAAAAGIDGKIKVGITVDKTGAVRNPAIIAGPAWPCGADPAKEVEAVREALKTIVAAAKFSPAIREGKIAESDLVLTFSLGSAFSDNVKLIDAEKSVASGAKPPKLVDAGVLTGKAVSIPKPEYPLTARGLKQGGIVTAEVLVDEEGNVILAGVIGGPELLQAGSRQAACGAKFAPLVLGGTPVRFAGTLTFTYVAP